MICKEGMGKVLRRQGREGDDGKRNINKTERG